MEDIMCCKDKNSFVELYNRVYPDVEKIVRRYEGMLLTQRLMDSMELDIYDYKCILKYKYCVEDKKLDKIIKSCYQEAVQRLEQENSKYDENYENSFVCQSIREVIKTKEI